MATPTQGELIARVRNQIGEPETDFIAGYEIATWLDDAQRYLVISLRDEALPQLCTDRFQTGAAKVELYDLPTDLARIRAVEVDSNYAPYIAVQQLAAVGRNKFWGASYVFPYHYVSGGFMLGIKPAPATTPQIRLRYVCFPTPTSQTTGPKLPDPCYVAAVFYAAARFKEKEGSFDEASQLQEKCDRFIMAQNGGGQ